MRAVILAGGKGTRLKPYTWVFPKPLVPVGEKPILLHLIENLKSYGIDKFTFCVNHMAELIITYFGDGSKFGVEIEYSREDTPLGTVAPLKLIENLPENFLVLNGDLLTDLDFNSLIQSHKQAGTELTVSTFKREVNVDFGVMEISDNGELNNFIEKPTYSFDVSMGIYVFNKSILDIIPPETAFGFDNLMHLMLREKKRVNIYRHSGHWLDIGRPEDFEKANLDAAGE